MSIFIFLLAGNPPPGTLWGGAPPTGAEFANGLVPPGLLAVSSFPPYSKHRTVPAQAVIFKENEPVR